MTSAAFDVLGIGNAIVDVITRADDAFLVKHELTKGSMMLIDEARAEALYAAMGPGIEVSGGSCGNTMAGVASFGGKGAYIGKVRQDQLGGVFGHDLKSIGVSFDTPQATSGPSTARCLIMVTPDAQRTMNTYLGACTGLGPDDIDANLVSAAQVTYVEGYLWDAPEAKKAVLKAFDAAHAAGRLVSITLSDSFCVGRYRDEFRALIRDKVDILFGNESEITSLYEVDSFDKALEATRKEARIAALTRSEKGSVVIKGGETYAVPAAPVSKIVDTTGAGDLYAAGFLFGFTRGKPLAECARLGGIAAAEIISHVGARPETPLKGLILSLGQAAQSTWSRWAKAAEVYRDRRQLIILLMGFASGMPLLLTLSVLTYWMSKVGVDLTTIGIFALVGTPYAFKFAWAPLVDQMPLPVLDRLLGRRRSWMLLAQVGIFASTIGMAFSDPVNAPWTTALAAVAVAFFSATQDIAVDAYRIEILGDAEQGAGSATTQLGYRIALWIVDAMALLLPSILPWSAVLCLIATLILVGIATTLYAEEPKALRPRLKSAEAWIKEAVVRPFAEFFAYRGWVIILLFALLYKYGDALGGTMARPFYNELGFSGPEIFGVTKSFGVAATILGGLAGGILVARYGLFKSLLVAGILQAVTNLLFSWQAQAGHDIVVLTFAISADNFTGALGGVAFIGYLSSLCTTGMAGTQYALLTSLMAFGRTTLSAGGGWIAAQTGWTMFWMLTTLLAIPGLLLLLWLWRAAQKETPPSGPKEG